MPVISTLNLAVSPEVDSLAEQLGVRAELPAVLFMTQRVFPDADISVDIDNDPEVADEFHLVIIVRVIRFEGQDNVDAYGDWHRELSDACPAPLKHVFRLNVEFDE